MHNGSETEAAAGLLLFQRKDVAELCRAMTNLSAGKEVDTLRLLEIAEDLLRKKDFYLYSVALDLADKSVFLCDLAKPVR